MANLDYLQERGRWFADNITAEGKVPVAVTYRQVTGQTVDPVLQTVTPTNSDTVTTALKEYVTLQRIALSQGKIQIGDALFYIAGDNLSGLNPTVNDTLLEGTTTWRILSSELDIIGALWTIVARKY